MLKDLRNVLNGGVFGVTLIVPGVSSTMFAITLGFYDELLEKVNCFRKDWRASARYLVVFVIGVLVGMVGFSSVMIWLLANHSVPTMMLFMGLLIGMMPLTYERAGGKKIGMKRGVLAAIAMVALFVMSLGVGAETGEVAAMGIWMVVWVFVAGVVNGVALVVPGLSGAFLLLLMGLYPLVIRAVSMVGDYLRDMSNLELLGEVATVVAPFGLGALVGFVVAARVMGRLMKNYRKGVYAVVLGLLVGSVVALANDPVVTFSGTDMIAMATGGMMFIVGGMIAYVLGSGMSLSEKKRD
ncbi:DUF368 domain-containing protein [Candidatus Saccharibacteria bacterium]|nr:DUF368 domain-containing protein [Candidatus Saccharibacteria bacterium]